jgi:hypothetical protein
MGKRPGVSGAVFDEWERWSGLGLGLAGLASGYTRARLPEAETDLGQSPDAITLADFLAVLPGATAAVAESVQTALFDLVAQVEDQLNRLSSAASMIAFTSPPARALHAWLSGLDEQFRQRQSQRAERAAEFLATVGPETTAELLSRVDMNMVLSDVDMDALVERVTMDRVLEKVDVNTFMADVVTTLDAAGLLRESTGALASQTVDQIRTLPGTATRIAGRVVRRPGG